MKVVLFLLTSVSIQAALALTCPDLSGSYQCSSELDGQSMSFSKTLIQGIDAEGEFATAVTEQAGAVKGYVGKVNKYHGIEWTLNCFQSKFLVQEQKFPNKRVIMGYAMKTHYGYYTRIEEGNQVIGFESCTLLK